MVPAAMQANGKASHVPPGPSDPASTGLVEAATALDRAIVNHEKLVHSLRNCGLDSQRGIAKAAELAQQIAGTQQHIGQHVKTLLEAINAVRERNMAAVEVANGCIEALDERSTQLQALLERFARLGGSARDLNEVAVQQRAANGEPAELRVAQLEDIVHRMQTIRDEARQLSEEAGKSGFDDLVQQADQMAQQIASLQNKLKLVAEKLRSDS